MDPRDWITTAVALFVGALLLAFFYLARRSQSKRHVAEMALLERRRLAVQYGPGSFGCHEAMHMASAFSDMVAQRLVEHPAIELRSEWLKKATDAAELLHELYQDIAERHMPGGEW